MRRVESHPLFIVPNRVNHIPFACVCYLFTFDLRKNDERFFQILVEFFNDFIIPAIYFLLDVKSTGRQK